MTATAVTHACARCGRKQPADRMVFSKHTRLRYCRDFLACDRRVARGNALIARRTTA